MTTGARVAGALGGGVGAGGALLAYGLWEAQAYTVRHVPVPVLEPGRPPLKVLHVSDLHLRTDDHRKAAWIRGLADLEPDLVVNTGDTISAPDAVATVLHALEPLAAVPGVFVPGNNDYYVPRPPNLLGYFRAGPAPQRRKPRLPWEQVAAAMAGQGWHDLTHRRLTLDVAGLRVHLGGLDDPYLRRARYDRIAGPVPPDADVGLAVLHAPEPPLLDRFAADGYRLALAGHTHGGQIRVPFGPALVTNCGIDRARARGLSRWDDPRLWLHVCAGLGTNPFAPVRVACRPEATLLTLVPRLR